MKTQLAPSVIARQAIEKKIVNATIKSLLAAGYFLTVHDGEEEVLKLSRDTRAIRKALYSTDEDSLIAYRKEGERGFRQVGWVMFIYGNDGDGWNVIHDYTTNLEELLKPAETVAYECERAGRT
jgi:hypothetical protein